MSTESTLVQKLTTHFSPAFLDVKNESFMHNVPAGSESHFKATIVSNEFEGKRLIQRHRLVNQCLADELENKIHALALHTYTQQEWVAKGNDSPDSPQCRGGNGQ